MSLKLLLKKLFRWLIIIGITAGLIFVFLHFKKPAITVPTVAVTQGSLVEQVEVVGYVKVRSYTTVKSQIHGVVEEIYHDKGEYVTKGTPLIKIRPVPSPEAYAEARKNLADAISKETEANIISQRQNHLVANRIISSDDADYTAAKHNYVIAKNDKVLAEQKIALLEHGETVVGGKQIESVAVSPVAGNILYRGVNVGDHVVTVSASQAATTLFTIADMSELMFEGVVDERDAAKIKPGMVADIKIDSLLDQKITGTVTDIAALITNVGFKVEVSNLQFAKDLMSHSRYAGSATIMIKKVDDVLMLPLRVIQYKDNKPYVLLPTGGNTKPKQQPVELGISDNVNVEIRSGLIFNELVIDGAASK